MQNADKGTQVWGSSGLVWSALLVGTVVSGGDALTMRAADVSVPVLRFVELIGMPGGIGAWFVNLLLHGGHSVSSPVREFALSLPFNVLAYWMLIRAGAGIVWIFRPTKAAG